MCYTFALGIQGGNKTGRRVSARRQEGRQLSEVEFQHQPQVEEVGSARKRAFQPERIGFENALLEGGLCYALGRERAQCGWSSHEQGREL